MTDPLREIWKRDRRYAIDAYKFLLDALEQAVHLTGRDRSDVASRHVSGQELLEGLRVHALHLFGPLAAAVWRSWGVHETLDWGKIVFRLIDAQILNRQDEDTIDDFRDGFDLDEAFVRSYRPELPDEIGVSPVEDEP